MTNTDQMGQQRDEKGRITGGTPPAGFNVHPENRNPGGWKKTDTPRWKLEQMMKLSESEIRSVADDKDAPYFERKLATAICKADWKTIESMMTQVYGQPKQTIDTTLAVPQPLAPVRDQDVEAD